MKTLDEVIEAVKNCDSAIDDCAHCAYYTENCENLRPLRADALQYLKAYKEDRNELTALRAYLAEMHKDVRKKAEVNDEDA